MIKISDVTKAYKTQKNQFLALKNINMNFNSKGLYIIYGKSGCGKSTLLNLIAGFEKPTLGKIELNEGLLSSKEIGYIIQNSYFIFDFTVNDNLKMLGYKQEDIDKYLLLVGLIDKKNVKVKLLSGGEKQRLAIIRKLLKNVKVILMDEPTGNLDDENSQIIKDLIVKISNDILVIVVTHDKQLFQNYADYFIEIENGSIVSNSKNNNKVYSNNTISLEKNIESQDNVKKFTFLWQIKYMLKLLSKKRVMTFFWLLIMCVTLVCGAIASSFTFYNPNDSFERFLNDSKISQISLNEIEYLNNIYKGDKLKNTLKNNLNEEVYGFIGANSNKTEFNFFVYEKKPNIEITGDYSGIVITDYLSKKFFNTENSIGNQIDYEYISEYLYENQGKSGKISGIIKTNYKEVGELGDDVLAVNMFKYKIAYINRDNFINSIKESALTLKNTRIKEFGYNPHSNLKVKIGIYKDPHRNSTIGKYDVVVSDSYKKSKSSMGHFSLNLISGNDRSPNIYEIDNSNNNHSLIIRGYNPTNLHSFKNDENFILISKDYYNEIFNKLENYIYDGFSISSQTNDIKSTLIKLRAKKIEPRCLEGRAIFKLDSVLNENQMKNGMYTALGIFAVIMYAFILFSTNSLISYSKKDMLTLKMERVSNYKIIMPLIMQETVKLLIAFIIAIPLMSMGVYKLNLLFSGSFSKTILSSYFSINPLILGLNLLVSTTFIGFTLFVSLFKLSRMELSRAIKDSL